MFFKLKITKRRTHVGKIMQKNGYKMTNMFLHLQFLHCCVFVSPPICSWIHSARVDQPLLCWKPRLWHHSSMHPTGGPGLPVPVCHWLQRRWTQLLRYRVLLNTSWYLVFSPVFMAYVPKRFRVFCVPHWSSSHHHSETKLKTVEGDASVLHHHLPICFSSPHSLPQLILHLIRTCSLSSWCLACH